MLFVQFEDDTEAEVVSWFACKPETDSEPFLGEVAPNDPRYKKYYEDRPKWMRDGMPAPVLE